VIAPESRVPRSSPWIPIRRGCVAIPVGDQGTDSFQAREETNKCQASTSSASSVWWPSAYETPLRTGALPRPLAVAVLTSAGVDALAPVVLAVPRAVLVIPAGGSTFVVLGITGVHLARGSGRS
jgi:hypothetical protein